MGTSAISPPIRDQQARYDGFPYFIPGYYIDLDVVLAYVRALVDAEAIIQPGSYPKCETEKGFWVATEDEILLEDARAMMLDTDAWHKETELSTADAVLKDGATQGCIFKYESSSTWAARLSVGRAKKTRNPWPFIMRPRAGFLQLLKHRLNLKSQDSSTPVANSSGPGSIADNELLVQGLGKEGAEGNDDEQEGNLEGTNSATKPTPLHLVSVSATESTTAQIPDHDLPVSSVPSAVQATAKASVVSNRGFVADNRPLGQTPAIAREEDTHFNIYGNTTVENGQAHLGNVYKTKNVYNDNRQNHYEPEGSKKMVAAAGFGVGVATGVGIATVDHIASNALKHTGDRTIAASQHAQVALQAQTTQAGSHNTQGQNLRPQLRKDVPESIPNGGSECPVSDAENLDVVDRDPPRFPTEVVSCWDSVIDKHIVREAWRQPLVVNGGAQVVLGDQYSSSASIELIQEARAILGDLYSRHASIEPAYEGSLHDEAELIDR